MRDSIRPHLLVRATRHVTWSTRVPHSPVGAMERATGLQSQPAGMVALCRARGRTFLSRVEDG